MSHREPEPCRITDLAGRGVLRISGGDAKTFLQGLLTNDVGKTDGGAAIHAGLLSPQGKILFDFFVVPDGDDFLIDAPTDSLEPLAKRLSFYKLRSDVTVEMEPTATVSAVWGDLPAMPEGAIAIADPRLPALGVRVLMPKGGTIDNSACTAVDEPEYHSRRIALGVPEAGQDYTYSEAFPHEALYDQLDGVDFAKGCYVGQEVVSRMEHRGTARKRVVPIEGDAPLVSGADVMADAVPVGTIGSVNGHHGLALLRLDRVASARAKATPLQSGSTAVTVRLPEFATFAIPTAEGV